MCIDLFVRKNKTYGFEEYRKDPENIMGWYKIGNYSGKIFDTKEEAYNNACVKIKWLKNCQQEPQLLQITIFGYMAENRLKRIDYYLESC